MTLLLQRPAAWRHGATAAALVLLAASCAPGRRGQSPDGELPARVRATAQRLTYAPELGDEQFLPFVKRDARVPGAVRARIEPVANFAPAQDGGHVIARIISEAAYPRLGIPRGTSYVWATTAGGRLRELVVPATAGERAYWLQAREPTHAHDQRRHALFLEGDGGICVRCPEAGWCSGTDTSFSVPAR